MKRIVILLITVGLAPLAPGQALPDNPAPPDPAWSRLQSLTYGQPIVVDNTNGPPVHCLFTGVTDAYLFCSPPGNPPGVGFRFNHADVLGVDRDLPALPQAQASQPQRDYHPGWIASMIAGGFIVGLCATRTTSAGNAAEAGLVGAGIVGFIGAPFVFLPHPQNPFAGSLPPQYGIGIRLRPIRPHLHPPALP